VNERGTEHQRLNTQDVVHRIEGKSEVRRFAIKLMEHKWGPGILPRGIVDKGYDQGNMPMALTRGKGNFVTLLSSVFTLVFP
jgi:hypothetical protein